MGLGIFNGFEYYRTPTAADYENVLTGGLVVLDTNSLLNLYRYTAETRADLINVLIHLGDRLWVPHQVLVEFWRNRENVLRDRPDVTRTTVAELSKLKDEALNSIRAWSNRVSLSENKRSAFLNNLSTTFVSVIGEISTEGADPNLSVETHIDPVLAALEPVLDGRVGPPLSDDAWKIAEEEALRRIAAKLPPGYKDGNIGDYLVWEQTLIETQSRNCDVLFVTGDVKEDWWREESGEKRGPRKELHEEIGVRAGVRLFMVRPATLLKIAPAALDVTVRSESLLLAQRVDADAIKRGDTHRLIVQGDFATAANHFTRMIKNSPNSETPYIGRAQAYYGMGRLEDALADLESAELINPMREGIDQIRESMTKGTWSPRPDALAQVEMAEFVQSVRTGDAEAADVALQAAESNGLTNPAYLCIDKAIIGYLRGDTSVALETLVRLAPPHVGPYVRINIEILRLLAQTQGGEWPSLEKLHEYKREQYDFDYSVGPLEWLRLGLVATNQMTAETIRLFDHLDKW